jgi:hypothetical protein
VEKKGNTYKPLPFFLGGGGGGGGRAGGVCVGGIIANSD